MLIGNPHLYPDRTVPVGESNAAFNARFSTWASQHGLSTAEFLLPIIQRKTALEPFRFERRMAASSAARPSKALIDSMGPWEYGIDWGGVATRELHNDLRDLWVQLDWKVHRYRASLLIDLAAEVAGSAKGNSSVLDVACHCGIFALEFAEVGFGSVKGLDLRSENIRQAKFLQETFDCRNVSFAVANARDLNDTADVVFCGGLLYHVTFPIELVASLFAATREILILDSLCQNHPFSGFHIYDGKDTNRSLEGDKAVELMPTYRAMIDLLRIAGFQEIYEVLGDRWDEVHFYKDRVVRSLVAVKPGSRYADRLRALVTK